LKCSMIGSSEVSPQSGKARTGFWKAACADLWTGSLALRRSAPAVMALGGWLPRYDGDDCDLHFN
jgi:hypothetical protein